MLRSLVGSEMCIRDSHGVDQSQLRLAGGVDGDHPRADGVGDAERDAGDCTWQRRLWRLGGVGCIREPDADERGDGAEADVRGSIQRDQSRDQPGVSGGEDESQREVGVWGHIAVGECVGGSQSGGAAGGGQREQSSEGACAGAGGEDGGAEYAVCRGGEYDHGVDQSQLRHAPGLERYNFWAYWLSIS